MTKIRRTRLRDAHQRERPPRDAAPGGQMMKISDLDFETRKLIVFAHIVAERPTEENLARLRSACSEYDLKHAEERTANLMRALFEMEASE